MAREYQIWSGNRGVDFDGQDQMLIDPDDLREVVCVGGEYSWRVNDVDVDDNGIKRLNDAVDKFLSRYEDEDDGCNNDRLEDIIETFLKEQGYPEASVCSLGELMFADEINHDLLCYDEDGKYFNTLDDHIWDKYVGFEYRNIYRGETTIVTDESYEITKIVVEDDIFQELDPWEESGYRHREDVARILEVNGTGVHDRFLVHDNAQTWYGQDIARIMTKDELEKHIKHIESLQRE
jgi:hypothetical protein